MPNNTVFSSSDEEHWSSLRQQPGDVGAVHEELMDLDWCLEAATPKTPARKRKGPDSPPPSARTHSKKAAPSAERIVKDGDDSMEEVEMAVTKTNNKPQRRRVPPPTSAVGKSKKKASARAKRAASDDYDEESSASEGEDTARTKKNRPQQQRLDPLPTSSVATSKKKMAAANSAKKKASARAKRAASDDDDDSEPSESEEDKRTPRRGDPSSEEEEKTQKKTREIRLGKPSSSSSASKSNKKTAASARRAASDGEDSESGAEERCKSKKRKPGKKKPKNEVVNKEPVKEVPLMHNGIPYEAYLEKNEKGNDEKKNFYSMKRKYQWKRPERNPRMKKFPQGAFYRNAAKKEKSSANENENCSNFLGLFSAAPADVAFSVGRDTGVAVAVRVPAKGSASVTVRFTPPVVAQAGLNPVYSGYLLVTRGSNLGQTPGSSATTGGGMDEASVESAAKVTAELIKNAVEWGVSVFGQKEQQQEEQEE
ncbi:hypothetical protein HDU96_009160 [Phlyctochytrium bullatum]|nr:hypothetical protein HDU96_009160 [Phlyctochytrium bullatum]